MWFSHLALSGDVGHVFVAQLRCKHAGDISQFSATLFCLCRKEYAGCSDFLQEQVRWDAEAYEMGGLDLFGIVLYRISHVKPVVPSRGSGHGRERAVGTGFQCEVAWRLSLVLTEAR